MKPAETVCYNTKTAWHTLYRMYNGKAVKHGITTSIGFVLLNIDMENGTPATRIAPLIGLETRSLTRMLRSLEKNGLICRVPDEHDRRMVRIFLTEKGKEKREISRQTVLSFNHLVREKIAPGKLDVFFEVINEIVKLAGNGKNKSK